MVWQSARPRPAAPVPRWRAGSQPTKSFEILLRNSGAIDESDLSELCSGQSNKYWSGGPGVAGLSPVSPIRSPLQCSDLHSVTP